MSDPDQRSMAELMADVAHDIPELVRAEAALVRREFTETLDGAKQAAIATAVAGALLWGAFLCLLAAIVIGLSALMPAAWAALLVAVVCALVGMSALAAARRRMRSPRPALEHAAERLRRDVETVKEHAR